MTFESPFGSGMPGTTFAAWARRAVYGAAIVAALAGPGAGAARADVIYMFDGRELEGVVVSEDARAVVLEVETGRITVSRAQIERIEKKAWKPRSHASAGASSGASGGAPTTGSSGSGATTGGSSGGDTGTGGSTASPTGSSTGSAAAAAKPSPEVGAILAEARKQIAAARPKGADAVRPIVDETASQLMGLGLEAAPAVGAALAAESDPDLLDALDRALSPWGPGTVPEAPIADALRRAGAGASVPLLRAAARLGGAAGAKALLDLLDEAGRLERERAGNPSNQELAQRSNALSALVPETVTALGGSGQTPATERLLTYATAPPPGVDQSRAVAAFNLSLQLLLRDGEDRAGAKRVLQMALERLDGDALASLLLDMASARNPETLSSLVGAVQRLQSRSVDDAGRSAPLAAATTSLTSFLGDGDYEGDPMALDMVLELASDPDKNVRLNAVAAIANMRESLMTPAAITVLIDRYENDVVSISRQAHAALVRLNGGENLGSAEAWRAWSNNR